MVSSADAGRAALLSAATYCAATNARLSMLWEEELWAGERLATDLVDAVREKVRGLQDVRQQGLRRAGLLPRDVHRLPPPCSAGPGAAPAGPCRSPRPPGSWPARLPARLLVRPGRRTGRGDGGWESARGLMASVVGARADRVTAAALQVLPGTGRENEGPGSKLGRKRKKKKGAVGKPASAEELAVRRRAKNMKQLQKSLLGLQMEWHQVAERQTGQVDQQQRLLRRLEKMGAEKPFKKWQDGTDEMIELALARTLSAVEGELAKVKEEMAEKEQRFARLNEFAAKRQEVAIRRMKNVPLTKTFHPWRNYVKQAIIDRAEEEFLDLKDEVQALKAELADEKQRHKDKERHLDEEVTKLQLQLQLANEQRIRVVLQRLKNSQLWTPFNTWRALVQEERERRLEEQRLEDKKAHAHMLARAQAMIEKMGKKAIHQMLYANVRSAFNSWRAMTADEVARRELQEAVDAAVSEALIPKNAEIAGLSGEIRDLERLVEGMKSRIESATTKILRKMLNGVLSTAFQHWKTITLEEKNHGTIRAMVERMREKAVRRMMNISILPAFLDWRRWAKEAPRLKAEAALAAMAQELAFFKRGAEVQGAAAQKRAEQILHRIMYRTVSLAFEHWKGITREEKVMGHFKRIIEKARTRVIKRMISSVLWRAFSQWKTGIRFLREERVQQEEGLVQQDFEVMRAELAKWQSSAARAWKSIYRYVGGQTINKMKTFRLERTFTVWKNNAKMLRSFHHYRGEVEIYKKEMQSMVDEVGALRLFRDAVQKSEFWRNKSLRSGGGFLTLEQLVKKAQQRTIKSISGKTPAHQAKQRRYGLLHHDKEFLAELFPEEVDPTRRQGLLFKMPEPQSATLKKVSRTMQPTGRDPVAIGLATPRGPDNILKINLHGEGDSASVSSDDSI